MEESVPVLRHASDFVEERRTDPLDADMPPDREAARNQPEAVLRRRRPGSVVTPAPRDVAAQQLGSAQGRPRKNGSLPELRVSQDGRRCIGRRIFFVSVPPSCRETARERSGREDPIDRTEIAIGPDPAPHRPRRRSPYPDRDCADCRGYPSAAPPQPTESDPHPPPEKKGKSSFGRRLAAHLAAAEPMALPEQPGSTTKSLKRALERSPSEEAQIEERDLVGVARLIALLGRRPDPEEATRQRLPIAAAGANESSAPPAARRRPALPYA